MYHFKMPKLIKQISVTDGKIVKNLLKKAVEVFKIPLPTLIGKNRSQPIQIARMVVSNMARFEDGIHYTNICPEINRDRTTVYHYETRHKNYYEFWPKYRKAYNALFEQMYTNPLPILTRPGIKKLLKENGIDDKKSKVSIIITSGMSTYAITENYGDFAGTIVKLDEILKGYNHHIDIKL
tara:strand:+ start:9893 stop:10435 length:543 start_codon:yes stop_codon:yes gene_type:complete